MWYHPFVIDSLCVSSPRGRAGRPLTWGRKVSHCTVLRIRTLLRQRKDHAGVSWVCLYRQREKSAHSRQHPLTILFSTWGRPSPARKAGMTGTHLRMSQAGNAGIQLFPLFLLPKRRKALDISNTERRTDMKYHAVWKPGGRSRGGMGSMKQVRRQLQALKPRGTIPGKEAEHLEQRTKKVA